MALYFCAEEGDLIAEVDGKLLFKDGNEVYHVNMPFEDLAPNVFETVEHLGHVEDAAFKEIAWKEYKS